MDTAQVNLTDLAAEPVPAPQPPAGLWSSAAGVVVRPAESHRPMPVQDLSKAPSTEGREKLPSPWFVRSFVLWGAIAVAGISIYEMEEVLALGGLTTVELVVLVLFAINISWISLSFTSALVGFFQLSARHLGLLRSTPAEIDGPLQGRTAILMPTYNEAPDRVYAALEVMRASIAETGDGDAFDFFILSDTTDPAAALAEETAYLALMRRLGPDARVYYRRRWRNTARKAGNIADFCTRWGGAYEYMLVLDADSLMDGATISTMARRLEADPKLGLLQTVPMLINRSSLFARLQQFAGRVYGPVIATGLARWSGYDCNYWGHNAIIRTKAFTEAAGLPDLPGKAPFGGHILSHDFVEAALMRRAGWGVRLDADLGGSFEESPPSLIDIAIRDRRWCQGNLQHSLVLPTRGLHWMSRLHMTTGILSYLASPFWLLLILAGLLLSLQAHFIRPEYFPDAFALFPTWPLIDSERALRLFFGTIAVLFTPKLLGLITFLIDPRRETYGPGALSVLASVVFEIILSALLAPILMLLQTAAVLDILLGRDSGWKPQQREDGSVPLGQIARRHVGHVVFGIVLGVAAYLVSPAQLAWLSPALVGLALAIPLSALTASSAVGRAMRAMGVLVTPEEQYPPQVATRTDAVEPLYTEALAEVPRFAEVVSDPDKLETHLRLLDPAPVPARGQIDTITACADARIRSVLSQAEAVAAFTRQELTAVMANPRLLRDLAALPAVNPPVAVVDFSEPRRAGAAE
jgi:membrane glycosyltransferase